MKISDRMLTRLVDMVFAELKADAVISFKANEDKVRARALELLKAELAKEADIDRLAMSMMADLERQNPNGFERYKMFPLLKKRLAKEKGVVL